jgi:hypothetical protein
MQFRKRMKGDSQNEMSKGLDLLVYSQMLKYPLAEILPEHLPVA